VAQNDEKEDEEQRENAFGHEALSWPATDSAEPGATVAQCVHTMQRAVGDVVALVANGCAALERPSIRRRRGASRSAGAWTSVSWRRRPARGGVAECALWS
jgi:hypothetical protein